ncbi:MAG: YfhO family protein [Atopobiaceae bacterium]|jgi:uncharacterized membrane protein YfhO|nr:YfhO family protein [Atopobiaceae bacterium]
MGLLSFLVPLAILCVVFALRGLYPFGTGSVAVWDMLIQYVGYFGWLCNVMHGQGSLLYSFTQGLGESTVALLAYHLSSPFNLLLAFFDSGHMLEFVNVLTLAKLPCAGLACWLYLRRRIGDGPMSLLLSTSYALSGYCVGECSNIMWIDGVIMLPLVALGVDGLVEDGRALGLFLGVGCSIVFNWYVGYMVCLFCILYFVYREYVLGRIRTIGHDLLRFLPTLALGVASSLALFLPAVLGLLQATEGSFSSSEVLNLNLATNPWQLGSFFCITSAPGQAWSATPPVYASAVSLVLCASLLVGRAARPSRKVAFSLLLAASLLGLVFSGAEAFWSVLKAVTSFYFRHAFVVDFTVVVGAAEGWLALCGQDRPRAGRVLALAAGACMAFVGGSFAVSQLVSASLTVDAAAVLAELACLACAALLALALLSGERGEGEGVPAGAARTRAVAVVAVAALGMELGYNAWVNFARCKTDADTYDGYIASMAQVYSDIRADEPPGVLVGQAGLTYLGSRVTSQAPTTAEPYLFGTQGLNEYTSMVNKSTETLMQALGYSESSMVYGHYYNSPQYVPDTLLGMGYAISPVSPVNATEVAGIAIPSDGYRLYRYDRRLPFAYGVSADQTDIVWSTDPFDNQEALLSSMTDVELDQALYVPAVVDEVEGDGSRPARREFDVTVIQAGPTYLSLPSLFAVTKWGNAALYATVQVNGQTVEQVGSGFNNNVLYLGECDEGASLHVTIELKDPNAVISVFGNEPVRDYLWSQSASDVIKVETLDVALFESSLESLDTTGLSGLSVYDGHVSCDFEAANDECAMFRVPYDPGWTATVDGTPADVVQCYSALTGVELSAGRHHVELTYETPGLRAGIVASVCAVAAFALLERMVWRRRS